MDVIVEYQEREIYCTECNHPHKFHNYGFSLTICTICANHKILYQNCNNAQFVPLEELL
jgi:Zn finger protein HypA/HybF involved in hydrogenase expression